MLKFISRAIQSLAVGLFAFLLLGALVPAQAQGPEDIGFTKLSEAVGKKETRELLLKLSRGEVIADATNPAHKDALEAHARWLLFRFHYEEYHDPTNKTKNLELLNKDFDSDLSGLVKSRAKTEGTWPLYSQSMATQGKLVLTSRWNLARINAARCLARLAELEQPELVDLYSEVLLDEGQIDAVKYYMIRGLGDLLAVTKEPPLLKKEAADKAARSLVQFFNRKSRLTAGSSTQEVRGQAALRREVIKALGNSRLATLSDKSHPALIYMKVLAAEGVVPVPQIDERVEAAIALARVAPDQDKDYSPDYAAHAIGRFIPEFSAFVRSPEGNKIARLPCKIYSARMQESIEILDQKCDKQAKDVKEYVADVKKYSKAVLGLLRDEIISGNQVDRFMTELEKVTNRGPAEAKSLFKSNPESALKGGN